MGREGKEREGRGRITFYSRILKRVDKVWEEKGFLEFCVHSRL